MTEKWYAFAFQYCNVSQAELKAEHILKSNFSQMLKIYCNFHSLYNKFDFTIKKSTFELYKFNAIGVLRIPLHQHQENSQPFSRISNTSSTVFLHFFLWHHHKVVTAFEGSPPRRGISSNLREFLAYHPV